jgi:hypothetical protein
MRKFDGILGGAILALACSAPAWAHHSRAATFDASAPVSLRGIITKIEWQNPHIWVYFDVEGDGGSTNWACEGGAPNALFRRGWRPDSLKIGDEISVEGDRARNGTPNCNMRSVKLGDGTSVFAGDAGDAGDPNAARR